MFYKSCIYTGSVVSSTNKTHCQDIAEILLKVALNTINLNPIQDLWIIMISTIKNMCYLRCEPY